MNRPPLTRVTAAGVCFAASATLSRAAAADAPQAVDVVLPEALSPHRTVTVEWNPLALFLQTLSANVLLVPGDHHALVLSPFYTWSSTNPYATAIDAVGDALTDANGNAYTLNVLQQRFKGFGGELGYRYYFDRGGPRGFFVGPSLRLAWITGTAGNGSETSFMDYGLAADAGYEAIVADKVTISLGGGVQGVLTSKSIPPQQLPASVYANGAVRPRLLLAMGWAF